MRKFLKEAVNGFMFGFRQGPEIFFAPFVGAWLGVKAEMKRLQYRQRSFA